MFSEDELPPMEDLEPEYYLVASRTDPMPGGGSATETLEIPLRPIGDLDVDDVAITLIELYERGGYTFEYVKKLIKTVETYDPRES
jgi:hypothetical protein